MLARSGLSSISERNPNWFKLKICVRVVSNVSNFALPFNEAENMNKNDSLILIVDLESTCWRSRKTPAGEPQDVNNMEIIEFGCAIARRSGQLLRAESFLVRPIKTPQLSEFCTSLTGINQSMVDRANPLSVVTTEIDQWLGGVSDDFIWCSWGNYDRLHIEASEFRPEFAKFPHLNLKRIWRRTTGQKKKNGLANALKFHDLDFAGQQHSGIDDARNIVRLLPFIDWSLEIEIVSVP